MNRPDPNETAILRRELELHARQQELLTNLLQRLQGSRSVEAACTAFLQQVEGLFPGSSGALYLVNAKNGELEAAVAWGQMSSRPRFKPEECQAIRFRKPYPAYAAGSESICAHISPSRSPDSPAPGASLCTPFPAQGELLGSLYIERPASLSGDPSRIGPRLASLVAGILGLALANLQGQDPIATGSIRDPLTHLFRLPYMLESLEREIARAARGMTTLGLIMIDLDGLEHFNSRNGREAGDGLLSQIGATLLKSVRTEDIACRCGGDEFILVLPGASLKVTVQRARQILEKLQKLEVAFGGHPLEIPSTSCGIAFYPNHGQSGARLMQAAQEALQQAKAAGGGRVQVALGF